MKEAIVTTPGSIYFIREGDFAGNPVSPFVKIGLTKLDRSVDKRADDLKTGNPRELYVYREFPDVPCVSSVENALRYEFISQRVNLEWHEFSPDSARSLDEAVRRCEALSIEFRGYVDAITEASRYGEIASTSEVRPATPAAKEWEYRYLVHHKVESILNAAQKARRNAIVEGDIPGKKSDVPKPEYDWAGFREKYPELCLEYLKPDWDREFEILDIRKKLKSVEAEPLVLSVTAEADRYTEMLAASRIDATDEFYSLAGRQWFKIQEISKFSVTMKTVAKCHLMALCGEDSGVSDVCTFRRIPLEPKLDTTRLLKDHRDRAQEFVTNVITTSRVN